MGKNSESAKAARKAAAEARAAAQSQERARDRKVRLIFAAVVAVVMVALLAPAIIKSRQPAIDPNSALPKGVTSDTYGVKVGTAWTAANADSVPTLELWDDFQCPACGAFEKASSAKVLELADAGKVRLLLRPTLFLDNNLEAKNTAAGNPQSSLRATNAFGCAVDQGFAETYHSALFAAQPTTEGQGYSAADLTAVAQAAGMTGEPLTKFIECSTNKTYEGWAKLSYEEFTKAGVTSTPTGKLNGTELTNDVMMDPAALEKAITDAAAK
jgi:protein-disulfide isomerase